MANKTAIANRALSKLGERRVSNIDTTDNKSSLVLRGMWDQVLEALLTAFPWNFSIKRAQLASDSVAPSWGYNVSYTVPSDFLSLLEIKNNPDYRLERNNDGDLAILTDVSSPIYIRYISNITDTGLFDPLFAEVLAIRLAVEACEEITQSNTKKQILIAEYRASINEAYASDSIQDPPQKPITDAWLLSREQYNDEIDYDAST